MTTEIDYLVKKIKYHKMLIETKKNELKLTNQLLDSLDEYLGYATVSAHADLEEVYNKCLLYLVQLEDDISSALDNLNWYLEKYKTYSGVDYTDENWK